ncbi:MAG: MAPEG family protein [Pseudomonadota bacterium]|nr:MAPEG family protein [Pseudomonadota bacterium]
MILPISLTIAAAAALLHIWLSLRVSHLRRTHNVLIGDEGNRAVAARMRAHANFAENMLPFLILLALVELGAGSPTWLWGVAFVFMVARILHPLGMDRPAPNALRMGGAAASWLILLGLACYAIYLSYTAPTVSERLQLSPMQRAEAPF